MKRQLLSILMALMPILANAYDACIDGIYYNFYGSEAAVTYQKYYYDGTYFSSYYGTIVIPQSVTYNGKTYNVSRIDLHAFQDCKSLTSVTIPEGVSSILWSAFENCRSLTSIIIPNSVNYIGYSAFEGTAWYNNQPDGLVYAGKVAYKYKGTMPYNTGIELEDGTIGIADYAFEDCAGLTSVTIPRDVVSIGVNPFWNCSGLTSIVVASGNTAYDSRDNCNSIILTKNNTLIAGCKNTVIPNNVTSIQLEAFFGCTGLTSITIPNSVTSIGNQAFSNCTGLTSITIPSSVISIGDDAFRGCYFLTNSFINNSSLTSSNMWGATLCDEETSDGLLIKKKSVIKCRPWATSVTIPESVTAIGEGAFSGCSSLKSVTIPNSVTSIGDNAFRGCYIITNGFINNSSLTSSNMWGATLYDEETSDGLLIKKKSVIKCRPWATSVTIPESVTGIGEGAFSGCSNLFTVILESNSVVSNTSSYYTLKSIFGNQVKEYILGDKITGVGNYAFYGCSALTNIIIPESVTTIGNNAFQNCSALVAVTIPDGLIGIGSNAFQGCNNLKIYAKRGTDGLLSVWKYGIDPYETGTSQLLLRPSISEVSKTQTTIRYRINNVYSGLKYELDKEGKALGNNEYLITGLRPEYWQTIKLIVSSANNSYSTSSDVSTSPINPTITCENLTASSIAVCGSYTHGDAKVVSRSVEINGIKTDGEKATIHGLDPDKSYKCRYYVVVEYGNGENYTYYDSQSIRTASLSLSTQQPKVISSGNVIVAAMSNLDDEETKVGFEWRRTDWTDDFASKTGEAYLYGGKMEGYIRNLNTDKLWKYRPYYESDTGKRYYGDWLGIDPTDASYFEPTVYTYSSYSVTDNTAEVKGYAMRGSDNVIKQGFLYWKASSRPSPEARVNRAPAIPANAKMVEAKGNVMVAKLENLDFDTEYHYVAFVTTSENETFYGEEQTFRTGAGNQEMIDGIEETEDPEDVTEIARYDINGRKLARPQKGINIIRMSDGTSRKVMIK